jgi:hypothetical protein
VRLLLDAHISGRVIGRRLREAGHDVLALDEWRHLDGIDDDHVLELAATQHRILITHNVQDFPDILREWAETGREHAGCVIVVGIRLHDFGLLLRAVEAAVETDPDQDGWLERCVFAGRG